MSENSEERVSCQIKCLVLRDSVYYQNNKKHQIFTFGKLKLGNVWLKNNWNDESVIKNIADGLIVSAVPQNRHPAETDLGSELRCEKNPQRNQPQPTERQRSVLFPLPPHRSSRVQLNRDPSDVLKYDTCKSTWAGEAGPCRPSAVFLSTSPWSLPSY